MASKYTRSAKNQECQIRIPGICNRNPETTIFAHLNGAGMGTKYPDIIGSYACSDCHDAIDGRASTGYSQSARDALILEGMVRTQLIMIKEGVLKL